MKPPRRAGDRWAALYFVRYTPPGGGERRIRLVIRGRWTWTLPVPLPRRCCRRSAGWNPAADSTANRAAWTVRDAWAQYAASAEFAKKAPRSQTEDCATARLHVLSHIGAIKLADIDVPAVRRLHRAVEGDKRTNTRQRKLGGPGAARRAVRVLSAMLTWTVGEGRLDRNPIIGRCVWTAVVSEPSSWTGQNSTPRYSPRWTTWCLRAGFAPTSVHS